MKTFRFALALLATFGLVTAAQARVHYLWPSQFVSPPDAQPFEEYLAVAIDGDSFVVIADRPTYRGAFLYRRGTDGRWDYSRTLMQTTLPVAQRRAGLVMKNNLAVIDIAGQTTIWEKVGDVWTKAATQSPINQPGAYAISADRILIGADGCTSDGFIYQKTGNGTWGVTGRLPSTGACVAGERDVELNNDYALVNCPAGTVRAYHRDGAAIDWALASTFQLQGQSTGRAGPLALQNIIAAAPGSTIYRRSETTWSLAQTLMPVDYALSAGDARAVRYRDNLLVTIEGLAEDSYLVRPHVYLRDASGKFQNIALLDTRGYATLFDVSERTVIAVNVDTSGPPWLAIYDLPTPLVPQKAIVNDFNTRDVSGFETTPAGAYSLAGNSSDSIYRQSALSGDTAAVLKDGDWSDFESIYIRVRPNQLNGTGAWVGAALRYTDANNYYFVSLTKDRLAVNRRLNGVNTELGSVPLSASSVGRFHDIRFLVMRNTAGATTGDLLAAEIDREIGLEAYDSKLTHGRAALLTHNARADFDNLYVTPTYCACGLLYKDYYGDFDSRPLVTRGGTWTEFREQYSNGLRQSNTGVLATAVGGAPADDQSVSSSIALQAFGGTNPVPWFGLLARYQDPSNYYSLSMRGSGNVQIRKIVNGVTTVLAARSFRANRGAFHTYELRAYGDQLHGLVDGAVVVTAHDSDLAVGDFGVATYRASAVFDYISVYQP